MSSSAEREKRLSDFVREVMMAEACTSQRDFPGALYHIVIADMIHRTLNDLEQ
jgi:hypothetical protein